MLFARATGGPQALTVRDALEMATHRRCRGARARRRRSARSRPASSPTSRCGGWTRFAHADIADPVAALVLGSPPPLELLLVDGRPGRRARPAGHRRRGSAGRARPCASTQTLLARAGVTHDDPPRATEAPPTTPTATPTRLHDRRHARRRRREPAAAGRRPEGDRRVRLRQRPLDGRHALGGDAAQPAPATRGSVGIDIGRGAGDAGRLRGPDRRRRARATTPYGLEHRRPAGAGDGRRALPGRAGRAGRRRPPRDRPAGGQKRIVVDYEQLDARVHRRRCTTPSTADERRTLHPDGNLVRHLKIRKGDGRRPARRSWSSLRLRGRHAGPGVPRARSPVWRSPPRTAASTCTSPPSGCTSTSARSAPRSACRRRRYG